jgi:hypothetical protein
LYVAGAMATAGAAVVAFALHVLNRERGAAAALDF